MAYPVPENEAERLAELHALEIMDSGPSVALEGVCLLSRMVLNVPTACIGLVDRERQLFKAKSGWDADGTSREHSFSAWTIMSPDVLVVPDASKDPRFRDNIYVTGEPRIRFYVGAPIALRAGLNIGSLCIFGPEPRQLSAAEVELVGRLAQIVTDQFRFHEATRRTKRELEHRRTSQNLLEIQSRELWRRQTLLAQTERLARVGGWEFDIANNRLTWSDGMFSIYGLTPGREPSADIALSHFPVEARHQFQRKLEHALRTREPFELELPFVDAQGRHRIVRKTCEVEVEDDKVVRAFGILQDVTEQKESEQRMWRMANHDALTGLPNRGLMREKLEAALRRARRSGKHVGVLLIDIDQFKDVNDTLGHDAGDALLIEAAGRLSCSVSEVDVVARLGGDEFIVLLSRIENPTDGLLVAQRVLAVLNKTFVYRRTSLSCRSSIGVAISPDHGTDPSTLLKNADIALYRAKSSGRGVAVEYNSRMQQATENRVQLAERVRLALQRGEFTPYYQPKVSLSTGAIVGFEALLRWRHPRKGLLGPQEFGQAFEDPHLALLMGERLLEVVMRDMRAWEASGCDFGHVAINVSSAEFARGELPERVLSALDAAGLPPERLTVEVTETVFLGRGNEVVRQSLRALNAAGVRIDLDDFGTGYASLTHLKQFPVDRIKIDRSFVHDIEHDIDDAAIVRAVIHLGRSLGIQTVAEGVENEAQAAYLRDNGCDHGQGYLYSQAMPASRVPGFIRNWSAERATGRGPVQQVAE